MQLIITQDLVTSIHKSLDKGLTKGLGKPVEGEMCVEALICHKLGLPHSDNPPCVGKEVRKAKITLNDCDWSSNQARANGMRKLAIAQLGSNQINQKDFVKTLLLRSTQRILPFLIQKHYEQCKDKKLLIWKSKFESIVKLNNSLWKEFYNYYHYYRYYYYYYYNYYNYYNYYRYYYYNYYSHYYHYHYYNYSNNVDTFLLLIADTILQVLIELKSPGCEWLDK